MSYINNNHCLGWSFAVFQPWLSPSRTKPGTWVMDRWWPSMCGWTGRNLDNSLGVSFVNGNFRNLNWRYLPYIRPKFQAYVREYHHKILWPYMVQYLHFRIMEFPWILSRFQGDSSREFQGRFLGGFQGGFQRHFLGDAGISREVSSKRTSENGNFNTIYALSWG